MTRLPGGDDAQRWETRSLKECGTWRSGGTPSKKRPELWGGSIPWISAKSIKTFDLLDAEDRVTDLGAKTGTTLVQPGAVLFVVRGMSLAKEFRVGLAGRELTFNQDLKAIQPHADVFPRYLAYCLRASGPRILLDVDSAAHGTRKLKTEYIESFEVPLPPLDEQKRIAAILDKADAIRKKRKEAIRLTEELLKSVFLDMFGDPVTNPKGWDVKPLGEVADTLMGFAFKSASFVDEGAGERLCRGVNVLPGALNWQDTAGWVRRPADGFEKFELRQGDVVQALDRPWISSGQKTALVQDADLPALLVQRVARLRARAPLTQQYVYDLIRHPAFERHCSPTETTVPHISPKDLRSFPVPIPDDVTLERHAVTVRQLAHYQEASAQALIESENAFASLSQEFFAPGLVSDVAE